MEYIRNGICLQHKVVNERCSICGEKLRLGIYRSDLTGKKLLKIIQCKKCNTASLLKQ